MSSESKTAGLVEARRDGDPQGRIFQDKVEQGRYGPIFPKTPACYGFSIVAKIIPGREEKFLQTCQDDRERRSPRSRTLSRS